MPGRYAIGVDLGGTKIATGLTNFQGQMLSRDIVPTQADAGVAVVVDQINAAIRRVMASADVTVEEVAGIGICCPGPLDPETGVVVFAPNLRWSDVPIVAYIVEEFGIPTYLENDANAAALAEKGFGAGTDVESLLYITVSTGVGGGIILDNDIHRGKDFMAGEVGHTIVMAEEGPLCGCGQRGCLEAVSSGTAIARQAREAVAAGRGMEMLEAAGSIHNISAKTVADAAANNDPAAQAILDRAFLYLGTFIIGMLNVLNVEKVVIGGGVSKLGDTMFASIREIVEQRMADVPAKQCPIVPAQTGDNVGILGAVGLVVKAEARNGL